MFENLDVFKTAHAMARHAGQRQTLVARNIANADTPRYQPADVIPFKDFIGTHGGMRSTRASHLNAPGQSGASHIVTADQSSVSPNGNGVSVEDELLRAVDVKRQHDRALAIYRHSLTILRSSLGRK